MTYFLNSRSTKRKMSWGTELWDRYDAMCTYTSTSIDFLDNSVAHFVKERGAIETEYAKKLRALVRKYAPKDMPMPNGGGGSSSNNKSSDGKQMGRSSSRAGTLGRKNKGGRKESIAGKSGPRSLGAIRQPSKEDDYGHMTAYKQVGVVRLMKLNTFPLPHFRPMFNESQCS